MRKLLLFLLVFGAGLLVLRLLDRRESGERPPEPAPELSPGPSAPAPGGESPPAETGEPAAPRNGNAGPLFGLSLRGEFRNTYYDADTGRAALKVRSEDSRTVFTHVDPPEATDHLLRVTAEVFGLGGDAQPTEGAEATLHAASATIRRLPSPDAQVDLSWEPLVRFEDVAVDVQRGVPLAPLHFEAPTAVIDAHASGARVIETPDPVEVSGSPTLAASGTGLRVELEAETLVLRRNGRLVIKGEDGEGAPRGVLTCTELMTLRRGEENDPTAVEVQAEEQAALSLGEEGELHADRIWLHGREATGERAGFVADDVRAEGSVVWKAGGDVFRSGRARVSFDEHGSPVRVVMEDLPSFELSLAEARGAIAGVERGDLTTLSGSGVGPLVLSRDDAPGAGPQAFQFDLEGPATVQTPGGAMRSGGKVHAWSHPSEPVPRGAGEEPLQGRQGFSATGGVELESDDATLQAADVVVELAGRGENQRLTAEATRGASLVGKLPDGSEFTLTSPDHVRVLRQGTSWGVEDATGVVLSVDGPQGFTAHADHVQHFDPLERTLEADGHVSFESQRGKGTGDHLTVLNGLEHFVLDGTPDALAVIDGPEGHLEGRHFEREGERLQANGTVKGTVLAPSAPGAKAERYELECETLDLVRGEERDPTTGGTLGHLHLLAGGGVEGGWVQGDETTSIEGHDLEITGDERRDPKGVTLAASSTLVVTGKVWSSFRLESGWIDVHADRLDMRRIERAGAAPVSTAAAQGAVHLRVETSAARLAGGDQPQGQGEAEQEGWVLLEGRGERLDIEEGGEGRLEPAPGERVRVHGTLPSHEAPFVLTASEIVFRGGERIEASDAILQIERTAPDDQPKPPPLIASAAHMVATRDALDMQGAVALGSKTAKEVPWALHTEHARFEGATVAGASPSATLRSIHATGGVEFDLGVRGLELPAGRIARAVGDSLEGSTSIGTLRLSGSPARIESPIVSSEGDWIEFDPDLEIITRTGRGEIRPSSPEDLVSPQPRASGPAGKPSEAPEKSAEPAPEKPARRFEVQTAEPREATAPQEPEGNGGPAWTIEYLNSMTLIEPDLLVYVLQEPRFREVETGATMRASWAVFWLDRHGWEELPKKLATGELSPEDLRSLEGNVFARGRQSVTDPLFGLFENTAFAGLLREVYLEGPVEILRNDALLARADAIFLDTVDGHGWLANATVHVYGGSVRGEEKQLIVRADWIRHSRDGSLRANSATVTPCDFEVPHLRIVTEDLRMDPVLRDAGPGKGKKLDGYLVSLFHNRLELYHWLKIPLGSLSFRTDKNFKPDLGSIDFGDSARFGTTVKLAIQRPAGKLGQVLNDVLQGDPFDYDSHYSVDASYLGSRGILLDLGIEVESRDDYWLNFAVGGLPDSGRDRGYIRVPRSERDRLRLWYRGKARFEGGQHTWLDLAVSHQTDPGVQAEFFEGDFEEWEQNSTYAHWRLAHGSDWLGATAKVRTESFRTDIEELPSASIYRGRRPLLRLGRLQLLQSEDVTAEYLRRAEGTPGLQSPFLYPDTFPDGQGNRDVLHFHGGQRLEMPISLGAAGLRLTPFAEARLDAWNEGIDPGTSPTLFETDVGARLATTLWKRTKSGSVHQISPFIEVRDDALFHLSDAPLYFDTLDLPLGGTVVDIGTRARIRIRPGKQPLLDLEVRAHHAEGVQSLTGVQLSPDLLKGWSASSYAALNVEPFGIPFQLAHDGRYDLQQGGGLEAIYSQTRAALRITPDLRFEAGHRRGLLSEQSLALDPRLPTDPEFQRSFEAATVSGIWSWSEKWEVESRQVISLRDNTSLSNALVLRRFGHDIIFEIGLVVREGEGTSLGIDVRPRYGWRPSRLGYLGSAE